MISLLRRLLRMRICVVSVSGGRPCREQRLAIGTACHYRRVEKLPELGGDGLNGFYVKPACAVHKGQDP